MDKAAVLAYCRVKNREGQWIGCECCFTTVYDVMIVCTSIYQQGGKAEGMFRMGRHETPLADRSFPGRALAAPVVRRIFSSSPKDPRYHMLTHISHKFQQPHKAEDHEPRAAMFLNRFTRTLTIMYATTGLEEIVGISAEDMRGRSFYYCIAENCLQDAVKCLENAKGNDSIAYLRFWFRDPRIDDPRAAESQDDSDEEMTTEMSEDMSEGGVNIQTQGYGSSGGSNAAESAESMDVDEQAVAGDPDSRTSSGESIHPSDTHQAIFGEPREAHSSSSSADQSPQRARNMPQNPMVEPVELEAVISCASDGLVVCIRKARPMIPHPTNRPSKPVYQNGLFAAPWAEQPILPPIEARPGAGFATGFAPSLGPMGARHDSASPPRVGGPDSNDFMSAIREQAIFAWALTGINGGLADHARGQPHASATPEQGLPIWESDVLRQGPVDGEKKQENGLYPSQERRLASNMFGDPGLGRNGNAGGNGHTPSFMK